MKIAPPTRELIARALYYATQTPPTEIDPRLQVLVTELIGRVADKWTMLILEVLSEHGEQRFTRIGELVGGISQKMLTQTLRQMERDGLLTRTVHPVVPPRVEYKLTDLGMSLGAAFCGVWIWASENLQCIEQARQEFDRKHGKEKALHSINQCSAALPSNVQQSNLPPAAMPAVLRMVPAPAVVRVISPDIARPRRYIRWFNIDHAGRRGISRAHRRRCHNAAAERHRDGCGRQQTADIHPFALHVLAPHQGNQVLDLNASSITRS